MKRPIFENMTREQITERKREGRKIVSHGSCRAHRKPNSPKVRKRIEQAH